MDRTLASGSRLYRDAVQRLRMVCVARVSNTFHARVIAARLGSEGILTELRGAVDGPYPMGEVQVLVDEVELDAARELLLADEVEDALTGGGDDEAPALRLSWPERLVLLVVALGMAAVAVGRLAAL